MAGDIFSLQKTTRNSINVLTSTNPVLPARFALQRLAYAASAYFKNLVGSGGISKFRLSNGIEQERKWLRTKK